MLPMNTNVLPRLVSAARHAAGQAGILSLVLVFVAASAILAQTAPPSKTQGRLDTAVTATLEQGRNAILPPHISHLLGISPNELEVPVKQFAVKEQQVVKGFDVSLGDHDIVIFVEDMSAKESTFYLVSPRGHLRRVVAVSAGVGNDRSATLADTKACEMEKRFWLDRLAPEPAAQGRKQ